MLDSHSEDSFDIVNYSSTTQELTLVGPVAGDTRVVHLQLAALLRGTTVARPRVEGVVPWVLIIVFVEGRRPVHPATKHTF